MSKITTLRAQEIFDWRGNPAARVWRCTFTESISI